MQHDLVQSILDRWPNRAAVLEDVRAETPGLAAIAVQRWYQRGSIPSVYFVALVDGARRRRINLSHKELAEAHSRIGVERLGQRNAGCQS